METPAVIDNSDINNDIVPVASAVKSAATRRQEKIEKRRLKQAALAEKNQLNFKGTAKRVAEGPTPERGRVPGQNYLCKRVVAPQGTRQSASALLEKYEGVFNTVEEAQAHCKVLHEVDPDIDVIIVQMYNWAPVVPTEESNSQTPMEYSDARLNGFMKQHYEKQAEAKRNMDKRVKESKRRNDEERKKHLAKKSIEVAEAARHAPHLQNPDMLVPKATEPIAAPPPQTDAPQITEDAIAAAVAKMENPDMSETTMVATKATAAPQTDAPQSTENID